MPFDLVVANILSAVLLDYSEALIRRVARSGFLVLSGLTSTDVPSLLSRWHGRRGLGRLAQGCRLQGRRLIHSASMVAQTSF
jgi:ribosomal protein L11 methylase PrmA